MDNAEKLATLGTQDTRRRQIKKNKNKNKNKKLLKKPRNAICVGHHYTQTNPNNVNKTGER